MKFLVAIPSIRKNTGDTIEKVRATFMYPTDLVIVDGTEGKAQTLNRILRDWANPSVYHIYVTLDDDFIPCNNWQELVKTAFEKVPSVGSVGIDLSYTEEGRSYMSSTKSTREQYGKLSVFNVAGHIAGCFIAMRTDIAKAVGEIPILGNLKYQVYEDGWRGFRISQLGFRNILVVGNQTDKMLHFNDSVEYEKNRITAAKLGYTLYKEYTK